MENDNELKGEGNSINYEARMQDTRIGRFLSRDPLAKSFPWYSPYQFAGNTPIWAVDLDGEEEYIYQLKLSKNSEGKPALAIVFVKKVNELNLPDFLLSEKNTLFSSNGNRYEFKFKSKQEMIKSIHGKTEAELEGMSQRAMEAQIREAVENVAAMQMFEIIGDIENGAINSSFGDDDFINEDDLEWKGPVDYSSLKEPRKVGPFLKTTPTQRQRILAHNKKINGGVIRSDEDGTIADLPKLVPKGGKANMNQAEVDHKDERVTGGTNSNKNQRVVTKKQNLDKEVARRKKL